MVNLVHVNKQVAIEELLSNLTQPFEWPSANVGCLAFWFLTVLAVGWGEAEGEGRGGSSFHWLPLWGSSGCLSSPGHPLCRGSQCTTPLPPASRILPPPGTSRCPAFVVPLHPPPTCLESYLCETLLKLADKTGPSVPCWNSDWSIFLLSAGRRACVKEDVG